MAALVNSKQIRSGHRTHIMKLMGKVKGVTATTEKAMEDTKILLATLVRKQNVFEKCDGDILNQIDEADEIGKEIEESSEFGDRVIEEITRLEIYVDYMNRKVNEGPLDTKLVLSKPTTDNQIRLPKISLKEYDGSLLSWNSFWNQFDVSVHKNVNLSDIQKLTYLKSLLVGEVEKSIAGLTLISENYQNAVDILISRFGNKQLRITTHMNELRNLTRVISINNNQSMRKLYDVLDFDINNLKELQIDVSTRALSIPCFIHNDRKRQHAYLPPIHDRNLYLAKRWYRRAMLHNSGVQDYVDNHTHNKRTHTGSRNTPLELIRN